MDQMQENGTFLDGVSCQHGLTGPVSVLYSSNKLFYQENGTDILVLRANVESMCQMVTYVIGKYEKIYRMIFVLEKLTYVLSEALSRQKTSHKVIYADINFITFD